MIKWTFTSIVFFLIIVIIKLPAGFALTFAPKINDLQIKNVSGTIWNGHASSIEWQNKVLEDINWKLNFFPLLTGNLEADLETGKNSTIQITGTAGIGGNGWFTENLEFSANAALIGEFYPLPADIKGEIKGKNITASQGSPWCSDLTGTIELLNPEISSPMLGQPLKLDDTKAKLNCEKGNLVANITDKGEVLGLNVKASLGKKNYLVEGELKPGNKFPSMFKQGLSFVAKPISAGKYKIDLNGNF